MIFNREKTYDDIVEKEESRKRHLDAVTSLICTLNSIMLFCLLVLVTGGCVLFCLKPWSELCKRETELKRQEARLAEVLEEKEEMMLKYQCLISDMNFYEQMVRDKCDMALEGETIFRIENSENSTLEKAVSPEKMVDKVEKLDNELVKADVEKGDKSQSNGSSKVNVKSSAKSSKSVSRKDSRKSH